MLWLLSNTLARKSAKSSSSVQYNFKLVTWQLCAMPAARRRNVYSWYLAKWSNRSSSSAIEAESDLEGVENSRILNVDEASVFGLLAG